jgi:hypothetical protein
MPIASPKGCGARVLIQTQVPAGLARTSKKEVQKRGRERCRSMRLQVPSPVLRWGSMRVQPLFFYPYFIAYSSERTIAAQFADEIVPVEYLRQLIHYA